ncbi:MAG: hypothetical protein AAB281_03195, partial [Actinomycetota bacterium]
MRWPVTDAFGTRLDSQELLRGVAAEFHGDFQLTLDVCEAAGFMKTLLLTSLLASAVAAADLKDEVLPVLKIGTNTYSNAKFIKATSTNVLIKYDGGIIRAELSDLPQPVRETYFGPGRIAAIEREEAVVTKGRLEKLDKSKMEAELAEKRLVYRMIDGKPERISNWPVVEGIVIGRMEGGLLVFVPEVMKSVEDPNGDLVYHSGSTVSARQ